MADADGQLKTELKRAEQARQILDSELFKEAVHEIEQALLSGIKQSAFVDEKLREKLCQQYTLLHNIVDRLRTHIETGKLAEETIRRDTLLERARGQVRQFFSS